VPSFEGNVSVAPSLTPSSIVIQSCSEYVDGYVAGGIALMSSATAGEAAYAHTVTSATATANTAIARAQSAAGFLPAWIDIGARRVADGLPR